jgi:hypothetical protein
MNFFRTLRTCFLAIAVIAIVLSGCRVADAASNAANQSNQIPHQTITKAVPAASMKAPAPQNGITVEQTTVCSNFAISSSGELPNGILQKSYRFRIQTSGGVAPVVFF